MSTEIKVGDRITFIAPTRSGAPKLTRVVNGFWGPERNPTVRAHGWDTFVVRRDEISGVLPASEPCSPRYNAAAVNDAIASSNRAGRRIGGREARMIHALLKGRSA